MNAGSVSEIEAASAPGLGADDLDELMGAVNVVARQLQRTHETLHAEVARLQQELRAANEQVERSRRLAALGEMAAGIAHEVRNPLASISLYANMLESDLADRPGQRRMVRRIGQAVRGLDAIVSDVLAFSRRLEPVQRFTPAQDLLSRALSQCADLIDDGVRVQRPGLQDNGESVRVWCDPGLVRRALVNVIRNALQAMGESSRDPRVLGIEAETDDEPTTGAPGVRFVVSDTGPGLSEETMERMFNPFFTTRATGTGLGLAIVHRIIEAHGGRVVVGNRPRRADGSPGGARVEIHLPGADREPVHAQAMERAEAAVEDLGGA